MKELAGRCSDDDSIPCLFFLRCVMILSHSFLAVIACSLAPNGSAIGDAFAHVIGGDEEANKPAPLPPGYCGPCYGAENREGQCCNTCDDVRDA